MERDAEHRYEGSAAHGREFFYWLAKDCAQIREEAKSDQGDAVMLEDVAASARVGVHQIRRFEKVQHIPQDLDRIVAVYARLAGWADEREVYYDAMDLWTEHGNPHLKPPLGRPDERVAYDASMARKRQEARQRREARRGRAAAPRTSKTKRGVSG